MRSRLMASCAEPTPGRNTRGARWMTPWIGGDDASRAEPREREAQRGEVGAAAVDDDDVGAHSTPLVVGSSSPSRRNAMRSARPTPLKQASTMWCVFSPVDADVDRRPRRLGQRAEEVRHELGGQSADGFARELAFEHAIGAARKIDGHLHLRFVHGQQEAVARDAELVAQRLAQRLAERERAVLDGVVLVDLQIAVAVELEREAAVLGELLEHVIEEADAGAIW